MINPIQMRHIIETNDLLTCAIDLATHDDAELHKMLNDPKMLASLASTHDTSPATIARIAQFLTNPDNYIDFARSYELCPIHRCDINICIDDNLHN